MSTTNFERDKETKEPIIPLRESSKLTTEQAEAIAKTVDEVAADPDMEGLPENKECEMEYINPDEAEKETVTVMTDPNTGISTPLTNSQIEKLDAIDKSLAKLLDINPAELYAIPKSVDEIQIPDEFYEKNIRESKELLKIKEEDIKHLIPLIKEYRQNPNQNWYEKVPEGVKIEINKACAGMNNSTLATRKFIAKSFISQIVTDSGMDRVIIDMQQQLNKAFDTSEFMTMTLDYVQTSTEAKLDQEIATIDELLKKATGEMVATNNDINHGENNPDKNKTDIDVLNKQKNNFIRLKKSIQESYMLTDLIAKLESGKIKVKPKHTVKYKRFCTDFLFKYKGKTPFIINDITVCVPSLRRFLPMFTNEQLGNFVIAFCMQTMNYDSSDPYDHAYMSYFINNIRDLLLVKPNQEHTAFSKALLQNVYKAVCLVNHIEPDLHEEDIETMVGSTMQELSLEASKDAVAENVPSSEQISEIKEDMKNMTEERRKEMEEKKAAKLREKGIYLPSIEAKAKAEATEK